ncbi:hypothetical protein EYC84_012012 [Monilinia fructicola]|uniref:Uncharacterized protein n=1 Tax=Monilinia fructicola TaxID=38448 RepID=A0A5M9J9P5_MONFR|nr:hypothetical protein EYC84_012012 [Monilinia fructicola]
MNSFTISTLPFNFSLIYLPNLPTYDYTIVSLSRLVPQSSPIPMHACIHPSYKNAKKDSFPPLVHVNLGFLSHFSVHSSTLLCPFSRSVSFLLQYANLVRFWILKS